jgi:hypothetical protein
MSSELVIRFPTEEHRDNFVGWLCDGGGECQAMESSQYHDEDDPIVSFQYCAEDKKFATNDRKRYSPFPEGNGLVIAHNESSNQELMS